MAYVVADSLRLRVLIKERMFKNKKKLPKLGIILETVTIFLKLNQKTIHRLTKLEYC